MSTISPIISTSPGERFFLSVSSMSSSHISSFRWFSLSSMALSPFLCYPLNDQVAVCNADRLRAGVLSRHSHAAAARHLDERCHKNIEVVFDCSRCDNGGCAIECLTADSQRHGNGSHSAAGGNGNIAAKAYLEARFALIGQTAQGHEAAALTVHDAGRGFYRGLGQGKVFTRCHTDGVRVAKFGHFIDSFHKKRRDCGPGALVCKISSGAEHFDVGISILETTTQKAVVIRLCAAAASATGVRARCPRVAGCISRDGRRPQLVQQIVILGCLRGRELGRKELLALLRNLGVLCLDALSCESVQDSPGVLVLVVYDVPGRVLHSVPGLAGLGSQIVVDALDSRPGLAAAILCLHLHSKQLLHESGLLICTADLGGHEAVTHGLLDAVDELCLLVEAVTHTVVYAIDLAFDVGEVAGQDVAIHDAGAGTGAIAAPVTAPAAEDEKEEHDDPPRTIAAKAKAVAVVGIGGLHRHSQADVVRRKRHFVLLSKFLIKSVSRPWPRLRLSVKTAGTAEPLPEAG
nr:MAG TPA: hypothetical protein [Caudoviricetes sp.]